MSVQLEFGDKVLKRKGEWCIKDQCHCVVVRRGDEVLHLCPGPCGQTYDPDGWLYCWSDWRDYA